MFPELSQPKTYDKLLPKLSLAMHKMCQSHIVQEKESKSDEWFSSLQYLHCNINDLLITNFFLDSMSKFRGVNDTTINALRWKANKPSDFAIKGNSKHIFESLGWYTDMLISVKDKDDKIVTATENFACINNEVNKSEQQVSDMYDELKNQLVCANQDQEIGIECGNQLFNKCSVLDKDNKYIQHDLKQSNKDKEKLSKYTFQLIDKVKRLCSELDNLTFQITCKDISLKESKIKIKDLLTRSMKKILESKLELAQKDAFSTQKEICLDALCSASQKTKNILDPVIRKGTEKNMQNIDKANKHVVSHCQFHLASPTWPFRMIVTGKSRSGDRRYISCDNLIVCGYHPDEPKWAFVRYMYSIISKDPKAPYYENIRFSYILPEKIPSVKAFSSKQILFNSGSSYEDVSKIICRYTDDVKNASIVINCYLYKGKFIVFNLDRPEDNPLAIRLRFDILLDLQKEIELQQKCKIKNILLAKPTL
ncbi:17096_t:CDS:2 [Cetraspora pellucida]|uniref:17096_t:CDS:1 n=1 Tax=Cetraspora pellucida TaxID=1433469 RepID=A0A9N8VMF4_9GLOM|nr:17096_t:CDS:2 [Cetraspora pellucida]